ncbi:GGDEF domain-containing protein [Clostridium beijerinckii]|uniref:diguanylate cyclase domain-containing protein n=1 Tax=Clostridium beijerinckii TaxID=1520 RepID=UPI00156DA50D|nr:GGDEF domain-containing protein [Clostridium beijerinckii]NRT43597.1 GGDEF domain-containing protein [Clostridium beijerinckii]NRZ22411.1 GGDEF domain-containing protein [Clostridium beijerinckii]
MEPVNVRKKVDILITILIAYFFVLCLSYKVFELDNSFENYIMLEVVMIIALVSYYTNVTLALVVTLAADFVYMSYKLYLNFLGNINIDFYSYYWIFLIPSTAILMSLVSRNIFALQTENESLINENSELVMIDEETNIKNQRALLMELPIYMKLSTRHKIPVTLLIVKIKFAEKLRSILGKEGYKLLLIQASQVLEKSLREEDIKYIIDDKTFGFLTITDMSGAKVVKERFRENINKYDFTKGSHYKKVKLDIQIGSYTFDNSIKDSLELIRLAEKELEYDIYE